MADELKIILRAINQASGPIDDVRGSMTRLSGAASDLERRALTPLRNVLGAGLKVAAGVAAAGLAGLVATIGSSVGAAEDMEQGIADIAAAMGTSAVETAQLKDLITNLGMDPKLKVTAMEASEAIHTLGTAGLSVDQILGGAARAVVLLSNATGADFGQAAAIATDAMSLWNMKAEDMSSAVDKIVGVTLESKFGIQDYALALGNGAKGAVAAGISFDQFNEMLTATASNFTSGMTAGTSLTAMMLGLAPSTEKAKGIMQELGIITAEGRNRFFDLNGEVVSNTELSNVLRETLGGLTTEQRLLAVDTLFGRDALAAVNGMINTTDTSWTKYADSLRNTDAEQSAATRMDTFKGAMEILTGVIDTLKIQIGDAFLPTLRRLAEMFTQQAQIHGPAIVEMFRGLAGQLEVSLQKFLPWIEQALPRLIAQIPGVVANMIEFGRQFMAAATTVYNAVAPVVSFVAGLVDLKGILLIVGGLMAVSAVASVVSFVASIVGAVASVVSFVGSIAGVVGSLGGLGVALGGAGAAFTAILAAIGPVILIVGAVGAAVAALYLAWQSNWFGIRDITQQALTYVRELLANFPETIAGLKEAFFTWASGAMQRLRDGFTTAKQWVLDGLGWVVDGIRSFFGERIVPLGQQMFDRGVDALRRLRDGFANVISEPRAALENALNHVRNLVGEHLGPTGQQLFDRGRDALRRLRDGFANVISEPRAALENALNHVRNLVGEHLGPTGQQLFDRGRDALRRLGDGFREMGGQAREEMRRVLADIQERGVAEGLGLLAGRMYEKAREGMIRFAAGVNEAAPNLRNDMQRALNAVIEVANAWSGGANSHLFSKARDLLQRMLDGLNSISLSGVFTGILDGMINGFNGKIEGFKNHVFSSASALGTRIRDGLTSVNLSGVFNGILDAMIGGFNGKMDGFRNHVFGSASALGTRIKDGLTSVNLSGVMGEALQGVINGFNSIMDSFRNHVYSVMQGIGNRLMDGLRDGISNAMGSVLGKIQEITNLLPQWVKDQLGIHSPSTVFQGLGRNIMEGMVLGMQELAAAPQGVLAGVAASLTPGDNNGLSVGATAGSGTVNNNQRTTQNNFTVASGTSADADLMERVRVLNMLYGGAGV